MRTFVLSIIVLLTLSGCALIHNKEFSEDGKPIGDCLAFYFAGMGSSAEKDVSACGGSGRSKDAQTDQAIKEMVPIAVEAVRDYIKLPVKP